MSENAITTPYQHFVGLDGLPLEDGYIYIGTANTNAETSPISIYWDSDLTIPAYQPIRTTSGYMSKNGSPGAIFVNGDYSITVRDKNGVLIYTAFESNNLINITYVIDNSTLKTSPSSDDKIPIVDNAGVLKYIYPTSIFNLLHLETIIEEDLTPKLGGNLDCNGKTIDKTSVRGIIDVAPATGTTHTFNYNNGDMQSVLCPAGGTLTLAFSNMPYGAVSGFIVDLGHAGNCTIIHPNGMVFAYGAAPTYTVAGYDRLLVTQNMYGQLLLTVIAQDMKTV